MKNDELSSVYEGVYGSGSQKFFSESDGEEQKTIISMCSDWEAKQILEIGCGEGDLSIAVSNLGVSSILACDYSQNAIDIAKKKIGVRDNVKFICDNWKNISGKYDVILMAGVLEHFDDPFHDLKYMMDNLVNRGGCIVTSSPSFLNPRGYVWMTLALLLDVPMSLTDLHFLAPWQFEDFANANGCTLEKKSCDFNWGCGNLMIKDFVKRLPNALRDAELKTDGVPKMLEWLDKSRQYYTVGDYNGATTVYKLSKPG